MRLRRSRRQDDGTLVEVEPAALGIPTRQPLTPERLARAHLRTIAGDPERVERALQARVRV